MPLRASVVISGANQPWSVAPKPQHITRRKLHELVWSVPLTATAPQFNISDVALKNTCARFDIPVPPRGYWARLKAGKRTTKIALPLRPAGMDAEVIVGGRNRYRFNHLANEEILGPLPEPPIFPDDIALVRDRVRKVIGKVSVPTAITILHPAIARLIAEDERLWQNRRRPPTRFPGRSRSSMARLNNDGCDFSTRCLLLRQSVAASQR
jgi:hypothetical protein